MIIDAKIRKKRQTKPFFPSKIAKSVDNWLTLLITAVH